MKRRDFLQKSGLTLAGLPLLGGISANVLAASPAASPLHSLTSNSDNVLVLIQLAGGNDGLNTLIPVQSSHYYNARPTIAVPSREVLPLNAELGWHPAAAPLKRLYDEGQLAIVQGVHYPNPNLSHFRSTDIWLTATDSHIFAQTGWLGRYLETLHPTYPQNLPADPVAVQIGRTASIGLQSNNGSFAVTFTDPEEFYRLVGESRLPDDDVLPDTPAGDELEFIRRIAAASQFYAGRVKEVSDKGANSADYPDTGLGQSLRIVGRLLAGGIQTKVFLVSMGGNIFDTHARQNDLHPQLLTELAEGIAAFAADMRQQGLFDKVAGVTFSEFGRRVEENGSFGTDHGTSAPLFVFGGGVLGGRIHGTAPNLDNLDDRGNLAIQYDYRQVYASVLAQWFASAPSEVQSVLLRDFATLPLFRDDANSIGEEQRSGIALKVAPLPATDSAGLYVTVPLQVTLRYTIADVQGRTLMTGSTELSAGTHHVPLNTAGLPSGTYLIVVEAGRHRAVEKLIINR